nr:tRNA lysidine(34) synthetase TilS [Lachnospiraceae bacterium]
MEREFISKIDKFCDEKHMFNEVKHIVAGVSGGADSVCLLEILYNLKKKYNYTIDVVHINHCIRGKEADEDEAYVKKLCEEKNIEFYGYRIEVKKIADEKKLTEEEAGRQVRYDAFNKIASKYNEKTCIAVAHNMNDVCETMMFNLIRGTGLKGIASISPVNGNIIRPLLCVKREEIEAFLEEMKIEFKIDRTNLLEEYTRNKIRHNIIKYMDNINPKAIEHMARAAAIAGAANDFIGEYVRKTYNNTAAEVENVKNKKIYKVYLDICKIMLENLYIQKEVIRLAIMNVCGKLKDIEETHISDIIGLMNKQSGRYVMLPYGIIAKREYNELVITQENVNNQEINDFKNDIYGQYIDENNSDIKNIYP